MTLDLARTAPWQADRHWLQLTRAVAGRSAPIAALSAQALAHNAQDLIARASGLPIRVASKSVRIREVLRSVLALPGYRGILAYTLAEALWLAEEFDDIVVAYPSADRAALAVLARNEQAASRITIMVDDAAQLDFVDSVVAPSNRTTIRVALDMDASWVGPLGFLGVRRSPLHTPQDVQALAAVIVARAGFTLVGLMSYEAQIAGVGDAPGTAIADRAKGAAVRYMHAASGAELRQRRPAAVALVRELADLEFVNGGGTGSIEYTHDDPSVTEVAAGSGLFGPHLFDTYGHFHPAPALAFALDVVRKPVSGIATVLGGGWVASGPPGEDRLPRPVWPSGLRFLSREGAGEVQSPLSGAAADALRVGDRVWFRHTKAGEVCEHVNSVAVVDGDRIVSDIPTYRGEGRAFL